MIRTSYDVLQLTKDLVAIPSPSNISNAAVSDFLEAQLKQGGFEIERLSYTEPTGEAKVSLVAKLGQGTGGLGFFSHSDTVPGDQGWSPFDPVEQDGRLLGRGSCDMKGPLAATMMAAASIDASKLRKPLYIVVTADEEVGYGGAYQVEQASTILHENWPTYGVVAEPTQMIPVYAHKGGISLYVTAHGQAAHTSTDRGVSANFLIAPFLAEMAALVPVFKTDERYLNHEFAPPTFGFNMVLDDFGCKSNVTAAKTVCTLSLRTMPNVNHEDAIALIVEKAKKYDLEVTWRGAGPFHVAPDAEIVQMALQATGIAKAETVPFGTEALVYQTHTQQVILGPGNIAQAHTVGEWIDVAQLSSAVEIYRRLIEMVCL
ncbi:MAG: M20/M25/M40 family metallo-hydrolase [Chloroflexi bacterium]|nr:M20/M25/M40 family metallo-hydrolase [Chloroflexota bacterium]